MPPSVESPGHTASARRNADISDGTSSHTVGDLLEIGGASLSTTQSDQIDNGRPQLGKDSSLGGEINTKVIYRTQYVDERGRPVEMKTDSHPLEPPSRLSDHVVLEILSILTVAGKQDPSNEEPLSKSSLADSSYETRLLSKSLKIHSEKLVNALRAVIDYYPGESLIDGPLVFEDPYRVLFNNFAELEAYRDSHPSEHSAEYRSNCNKDIDLLLEVLSREKPEISIEKERHRRFPPVCTFDHLWLLFKPGVACFRISETGELSAYIVRAITSGFNSLSKRATPYRLYIWQFNFDGYKIGREVVKAVIAPFGGEKEIRLLEYFPCRYHDDSPDELADNITLRQKLIARGKKFWKMSRDQAYVEYDGISLNYPYEAIKSRVMVDPKTFFSSYEYLRVHSYGEKRIIVKPHLISGAQLSPAILRREDRDDEQEEKEMNLDGDIMIFTGCECDTCGKARSEAGQPHYGRFAAYAHLISPNAAPPNEDEFFFLCSYKIVAFVLSEGAWKLLNVDKVREVTSRSNAFDQLVLEPELKEVVVGLSKSYSRWKQPEQKSITTDFIRGKGEGCVFLLHGPPGVGKTATAEAIADYTQRPLLAITCGDLGTYAEAVEQKLQQYLAWGELWGAVVLLDEADIYLEKRNLTDVVRNSLVSVFLRALEYYKGLLFLTTNRVNTFDEAFTSRIHVALHYRKLRDSERKAIWTTSFERLKSDRVKVTKSAQKYACESKEVLGLEWNGREIRNAFQTAISLARFDAEEEEEDDDQERGDKPIIVRKEHLEKVVRLSTHFQNYLATMHRGMSDSEIAKRRGLRNDSYGEVPQRGKPKQPHFRNKVAEDEEEAEEDDRKMRRRDDRYSLPGNQRSARGKEPEEHPEESTLKKSSKGKKAVRYEEDEESEENSLKRPTKSKKAIHSEEDDESEEEPPKKSARNRKLQRSDEDDDSNDKPSKKSTKSKKPTSFDDEECNEESRSKKSTKKPLRAMSNEDDE